MTRVIVIREIEANPELVFKTINDFENLPQVVPEIDTIKFLSEMKSGVGTRFRETRIMKGKPSATELEVVEFEKNKRLRIIADSHGTLWDSTYSLNDLESGCELILTMDAKAHRLLLKMLNPLFKHLFKKGLKNHMDAVKRYCEQVSGDR